MLKDWIYVDFSVGTIVDAVSGVRSYRCTLSPSSFNPPFVSSLTFTVNPFGIDLTKPFVPVNTSYSSSTYFLVPIDTYLPGTIRGALWVDKHEKIYKSATFSIDESD